MPSNSLLRWLGERAAALDEIEAAHIQVGAPREDADMPPSKSTGPTPSCCHPSFRALVAISTPNAWTTWSPRRQRTCRL